jgi:hypothetical protein
MNQINTNARLKIAQQHQSEAEKYEIVKAAEAEAEAKRLSGVGMAEQRKAAILGLQTSVADFQHKVPDMTAKDIMALLLMNQYFDCVKDIAEAGGRGANTIFLPGTQSEGITESVMAANAASQGRRFSTIEGGGAHPAGHGHAGQLAQQMQQMVRRK